MELIDNCTKSDKILATLCHLAGLAFFIPFGNIVMPLIIWLLRKDESSFVDDQGKEVLNFQLTMLMFFFVSAFLMFVAIGVPLILMLSLLNIGFVIFASVKAAEGVRYKYPVCIRFIK